MAFYSLSARPLDQPYWRAGPEGNTPTEQQLVNKGTKRKVVGSVGVTPNNRPDNTRVNHNAASQPTPVPQRARAIPCPTTNRNTSRVCAPTAMRVPISRVRSATD